MSNREIFIFVVEDDPGDVVLMREGLERSGVRFMIDTVSDGGKALAYLRKKPPYQEAPRPDLIFLDLNLPKKDGIEVLSEIKSDRSLISIPVIVLTTSDAESDINKAYERGANCYLTKPVGFESFRRMMAMVEEFWLNTAKLPRRH